MTTKTQASKAYRKSTGSKAMTKAKLKAQVKKFWNLNMKANGSDFEETLNRALNCGALDLESKNSDDNGAIRIVVSYILSKMLDGCKPLYHEDMRDFENLLKF